MSEAAKAARAAYKREWYQKNKEKQREYQERYWAKKAAEGEQPPADAPAMVKAG